MKRNQLFTWDKFFFNRGLLLLLAILLTSGVFAQRQISGKVVDGENNEPLIGASILVRGTSTGTVTDFDGNFSIQASTGDVLVVTYTGYAQQEVTVGVENTYDIALSAGVLLEELVVTGYTAQTRRSITGAVSSVNVSEVKAIPTTDISQALQGKVAGVTVGQSGSPGEGVMVRIRGFGTINNNNPLYIIDGVPVVSAGLNELNPNDVESIQVLKDASAASIYGARAANGVVIITTKKGGLAGKPKISLDVYYGRQMTYKNDFDEFATPQELANILFESQRNAFIEGGGNPADFVFNHPQYGGSGTSAPLPDYITPGGAREGDPGVNPDNYSINRDAPGFNPITRANKTGTDWFDEIFDPAPVQSYQLSATGGTEGSSYALSAGYYDQQGILIHTNFKRYTLRANSQFRIKNRIRLGENITIAYSNRVGVPGGTTGAENALSMAYRIPTIIPVYDIMGNFAGPNGGGLTNAQNPVAMLTRNKDNGARRLRTFGNIYGEVDLVDGLTFKSSIGVDLNTFNGSTFTIRNVEASEPNASNLLSENFDFNINWTWYNTLNFQKIIAQDHEISILAGTEAIENNFRSFGANRSNFFSDDFSYRYLNTGAAGITNSGSGSEWALFSLFGKLDYAFKGKYLLSATIRRDGSSRFGEDNRYAVFPAFSVGWRVSDEVFLKSADWINDLKLRGGWGQVGNQEIGNYPFATTFGADLNGAAYPITGSNNSVVVGFDSRVFGNPDVKWETTTSLNLGIDASLFSNRLDISFDWYNAKTEDMLFNPPIVGTQGFASAPFVNIGDMENTGFDLALNYNSRSTGDFTYSIGANLSRYVNTVLSIDFNETTFIESGGFRDFRATRTEAGQPIGAFFGYIIDGIYQNQAEVDAGPDYENAGIGRFKLRDVDGDGVITPDDRTFIGSPHPDFTYGLNANFGYKGFDLTVFVQGVQGNDLFNANKLFTDFPTFQQNRSKRVVTGSFGFPGVDNASAILPLLTENSPSIERSNTTYYLEDGSFLRLKNVQLGYTLPKNLTSSIGIDRLRVYIQGINLLTFTNYSGIDPEVNLADYFGSRVDLNMGVDRGTYPVPKTFVFGLNAEF
jgi:TonB-dependent starch-binding outer membrane protein SusC